MEWQRVEGKLHRLTKWMKREAWLIMTVIVVLILFWSCRKVAVDSSQVFIGTLYPFALQGGRPAMKPITRTEALNRFRTNYMDCVSESGKWVYDPTPRHIPWNYVGDHYANACDARHLSSGSDHVANEEAEDIALRGAPGNWSVREELKWRWQTNNSCPWRQVNRDDFCRKIGSKGHVLVVGDSINHELQWSLMNALIVNGSNAQQYWPLEGNARSIHGPYEMCGDILGGGGAFKVSFVVNVHLSSVYALIDPEGVNYPWFGRLGEWGIKYLVLNTGVHKQEDQTLAYALRSAFTTIRKDYPGVHVIYRNTPSAHGDCMASKVPLSTIQEGELQEATQRQNLIAKEIVEEFGYSYMDVYPMLSLRPEAHISDGDCLHYCLPGPLDFATEYLYNILLLDSEHFS